MSLDEGWRCIKCFITQLSEIQLYPVIQSIQFNPNQIKPEVSSQKIKLIRLKLETKQWFQTKVILSDHLETLLAQI